MILGDARLLKYRRLLQKITKEKDLQNISGILDKVFEYAIM